MHPAHRHTPTLDHGRRCWHRQIYAKRDWLCFGKILPQPAKLDFSPFAAKRINELRAKSKGKRRASERARERRLSARPRHSSNLYRRSTSPQRLNVPIPIDYLRTSLCAQTHTQAHTHRPFTCGRKRTQQVEAREAREERRKVRIASQTGSQFAELSKSGRKREKGERKAKERLENYSRPRVTLFSLLALSLFRSFEQRL